MPARVLRRGSAVVATALAIAMLTASAGRTAPHPTAFAHLRAIDARSPAPQYRRFGSPGVAAVAAYAAQQLAAAGYVVRRVDVPHPRYAPDYSPGHQPELIRLGDHHAFKVDSAFYMTKVTGPGGLNCTVRLAADVQPGDCGLVTFAQASPDFRNVMYGPGSVLAQIKSRGGVAAVVEGDAARGLVLALRTTVALPTIVAVARDTDLVGQRVHLRVMGGLQPATLHNIVAVHRPAKGSKYVILTGHLDGWFQAASDNGAGAAAVLRTAQLLGHSGVGVAVGLFDGEEVGLLGSQAVAKEMATGLDMGDCRPALRLSDITADVNLDAPSARARDVAGGNAPVFSWRAMVFSEEGVVASTFISVFMAHGVAGLPINARTATIANGGMDRTDAHWFDAAGIPVAWPVTGYAEYHTDGDTLAVVDPADLEAISQASAELVTDLAALPVGHVVGTTLPAAAPSRVGCRP